jgi:hypothetical protein
VRQGAALAGCLLFAGVAAGNGLDRIATWHPARVRTVPALFAAQSLGPRGDAALVARDPATAAALGESYVAAAPLDPAATALLGGARLVGGDAAGADAAFRVAGQLGWRVPVTQRYWLARALQLGDWRVAAQRLDALLRQQPTLVNEAALIDPFETERAGRAELLARLALRPDWLERYGTDAEGLSPERLARRATVLVDLAKAGVVTGCKVAGAPVGRLAALGAVAEAQRLWRAQCGGGQGLVNDPRFARASLTEAASPFDWAMGSNADLDLSFSSDTGPRQLNVRGPARFTQPIASQLLVLAPGRYRLSWRAAADGGIEAAIGCQRDAATPLAASHATATGRWQTQITVDGACAGHWLVFSLRPGVAAASLGAISLEPF